MSAQQRVNGQNGNDGDNKNKYGYNQKYKKKIMSVITPNYLKIIKTIIIECRVIGLQMDLIKVHNLDTAFIFIISSHRLTLIPAITIRISISGSVNF